MWAEVFEVWLVLLLQRADRKQAVTLRSEGKDASDGAELRNYVTCVRAMYLCSSSFFPLQLISLRQRLKFFDSFY
jgi:hypothetical protein